MNEGYVELLEVKASRAVANTNKRVSKACRWVRNLSQDDAVVGIFFNVTSRKVKALE